MKPRSGIPDDIFRALRRLCAVQRTVRRTQDQVRRMRVIYVDASRRCATPAAWDCSTSIGAASHANPWQGLCRFAPVTGAQISRNKKPAEAGSCASSLTANQK